MATLETVKTQAKAPAKHTLKGDIDMLVNYCGNDLQYKYLEDNK